MLLNSSIQTFGSLRCRVFDCLEREQSPGRMVVLCHGFGAPGDDLASFGPYLLESSAVIAESCRFIFPEAPVDLAPMGMPGGRAWWPINMAMLAEMNETRDFHQLTDLEPPGMQAAAKQLADAVREMQKASAVTDRETVLGGFSQGAMVATDLVLEHGFNPELLVIFSGTLLNRETWTSAAAKHSGCSVLQSHGRQDMILPFAVGEQLRDMLEGSGFRVDFIPFNGPHGIPPEVLDFFVSWLKKTTG